MKANEMNCERARQVMDDRVDSMESPSDNVALDRHLASCENCRSVWADLTQLSRGLDELRRQSDLFVGDIIAMPRSFRQGSSVPKGLRLAAAIALAVGLGWTVSVFRDGGIDRTVAPPAQVALAPERAFRMKLGPESSQKYIAVPKETDEPTVHLVWLHSALPTDTTAGQSSPTSEAPSANISGSVVVNSAKPEAPMT